MLFFTNFRKKPNLFKKSSNNRSSQSTIEKANKLKQIYKNIRKIY